jgi:hypothetical protein
LFDGRPIFSSVIRVSRLMEVHMFSKTAVPFLSFVYIPYCIVTHLNQVMIPSVAVVLSRL